MPLAVTQAALLGQASAARAAGVGPVDVYLDDNEVLTGRRVTRLRSRPASLSIQTPGTWDTMTRLAEEGFEDGERACFLHKSVFAHRS